MAKGHREEGKHSKAKADEAEPKKQEPAEAAKEEVKDVLTHTEAMARAVEEKVREAARKTIADTNPAMAAERLVQMASAELQHLEVAKAVEEKVEAQRIEAVTNAVTHPVETIKESTVKMADGLVAKAEKRLAALPEPVKAAGRFAEKVAHTALWPARFGLHLAGELVRTPVTLARMLFKRSRPA